jgi:hypothetical protein
VWKQWKGTLKEVSGPMVCTKSRDVACTVKPAAMIERHSRCIDAQRESESTAADLIGTRRTPGRKRRRALFYRGCQLLTHCEN